MKNILIVTTIPFPHGNAPANRIFSYAFGFKQNGFKCNVLVLKPNQNKLNKGINYKNLLEDLEYVYPGCVVYGNKCLIIRKIQYIFSVYLSLIYFLFNIRKYSCIIFYGNSPLIELIFITISKLNSILIFKELSEHPNVIFNSFRYLPARIASFLYLKILFKYYDNILSMTSRISNLLLKNKINSILINNTIKLYDNNLSISKNNLTDNDYIAYIGSLNDEKDGILNVVKAIDILHKSKVRITLKIAGFGSLNDIKKLQNLIIDLNLSKNVLLLGELDTINIKILMMNSIGLISARPISLQSEFGFPTKILDYLSSMKPVITTVNGDLDKFIIDNHNALVLTNTSSEKIAEKIHFLIKNSTLAQSIGLQGFTLIEKYFNPKTEVSKILSLIKSN